MSGSGTARDRASLGEPERLRFRFGDRELGEEVCSRRGEGVRVRGGERVSVSNGVPGESALELLPSAPGTGGSDPV